MNKDLKILVSDPHNGLRESPGVPRRRRQMSSDWFPVAALAVGTIAIGTDMFMLAGLLGRVSADLEVTIGMAGLSISAYAIAFAIGAPLFGALLACRHPRFVLIGSLLIFGCCTAISAVAPTLPVLLGARIVGGLAASVYSPAAAAHAVGTQPAHRRGRALGLLQGASSAAMLVGAPFGLLLASTFSWRGAFVLIVLIAAVAVIGLLRSDFEVVPQQRPALRVLFAPLASAEVLAILGATVLLMAAANSMYSYLGVLLGNVTGEGGLWLVVGAFGLGGLLGTSLGGAAADRWGGRRLALLAGALLTAAFALLPVAASAAAATFTIAICWGAAGWAFIPGQQHRLSGLSTGPPTLLLASNSSAVQLGFSVGALLGGLVVDNAGAGSLWILAVGCAATAVLIQGVPMARQPAVR